METSTNFHEKTNKYQAASKTGTAGHFASHTCRSPISPHSSRRHVDDVFLASNNPHRLAQQPHLKADIVVFGLRPVKPEVAPNTTPV